MQMRDNMPSNQRGIRVALLFALAAYRLQGYYEHGQWLTDAQGGTLASEWLERSKISMPFDERRRLSSLSDQFARDIASQLSREAGLYTAHEMMEALDPIYYSEIAESLLDACKRVLDEQITSS